MEEDSRVPIILGQPVLATAYAMINVFNKKISLDVGKKKITFDIKKSMKFSTSIDDTCHSFDLVDLTIHDHVLEISAMPELGSDLDILEPDFDKKPMLFATSITTEENQIPKLKELPSHLEYAFLDGKLEFPIIISLLFKQDAKPRLIRWVLSLQEFTIEIKDKKGAENLAAGLPKALISDRGTHFYNSLLEKSMKKCEALRNANLDLDVIEENRFLQLNKLTELRNEAYEHSRTYKERTKIRHDARIQDKEFREGQEVLVFNSKLKLFSGRLKIRLLQQRGEE
nr:hypothetical protein [Tanacetum cinerariifolium]